MTDPDRALIDQYRANELRYNETLMYNIKRMTAEQKEQARQEAQKDRIAMNCSTCEYNEQCSYRYSDTENKLSKRFGGCGKCLRFATLREGMKGFINQATGEPVIITAESWEKLRE